MDNFLEPSIALNQQTDSLRMELSGHWTIERNIPSLKELQKDLGDFSGYDRIIVHAKGLTKWDSGLLVFLDRIRKFCNEKGVNLDFDGFPEGAMRLLELSFPDSVTKTGKKRGRPSILENFGEKVMKWVHAAGEIINFIGEAALAFFNLVRGKARLRRSDLMAIIQECGVAALPIVALISVLVGLIFAFVGAVQLRMFGAQIYVANLVGLAMTREMAAMMTGVIMAGRTGAAFAAQLGTMQVSEEIDAFRTFGISPMEFLVLPRMVALMLMMPLLFLYSNFLGIIGGALVGVWMLDLPLMQYYNQTQMAVSMTDFNIGLVKSVIFGVLVALAGCLRGMQCGRNAAAVGLAATSAVVTGIVWIIISDSIITVITSMMGL
jgi:phospholipid/cholesterol/gamma-HCH transport system permease protein